MIPGKEFYVVKETRQWTLKGLPPDLVDAVRSTAKAKGMKINAFVAGALREAVRNAEKGSVEERLKAVLKELDDHVEVCEMKLEMKKDKLPDSQAKTLWLALAKETVDAWKGARDIIAKFF